ncbi:hypothetical protein [Polyangium mundeleinium]|uniref:CHAT domain-containing protein n=1 Tax=Polyangium mundeleinium TaxID=2995306 RepID=A0ABT5EW13_9BACT|nr:hypothetical protein [Polyangium mundeleinium]MDC0746014.1 hypothetical protein [Polyangium mundeleinium]
MPANALHLLLSHDDDGSAFLEGGLPTDAAAEHEERPEARPGPTHLWDEGDDPDDLVAQRWGVIVPEGTTGDRLLELVRPLLEARRAAQGGHEVKVFRAPSRLDMAGAARWRKEVFDRGADLAIDLPRYQLILGDLDQVPFALQQVQQSDGFVGRLAFPDERGYEAYVHKILAAEHAAACASPPHATFYTVHDGTAATAATYRALVRPGLDLVRQRLDAGQFPASTLEERGRMDAPSLDELVEVASRPDPGVLFSVSHGAGAPREGWKSFAEQRARQGAMRFGREGTFAASDLGERPFVPGGIWFMVACYGGGTPDRSAYRHWLERLQKLGHYGGEAEEVLKALPRHAPPFIASLPRAALANPKGPLAFLGHVDLAWTYSFEERDAGTPIARPARFMSVVRSLVRGDRVGLAFRELVRFFEQANTELTSLYDHEASGGRRDEVRLGHLWMLRQDLSGYILLGDPAVRLHVKRPSKAALAETPVPTAANVLGFGQAQAPAPAPVPAPAPTPAPAPLPIAQVEPVALPMELERLEEAFGHMLVGERGHKEIAKEYGIELGELRKLFDRYKKGGRGSLGHG